ncbi:MAG: hypothetical protein A2020_15370 [Lentisphaerae bacterium GWF2_45_14]|nr:MAG: hypothetical protein A2020_15370 [Lentisphaerae bacterium GWF2_45_14]
MKLLILHHHSREGGVNRIISSQIESLLSAAPGIDITLLTGEIPLVGGIHPKNVNMELFPPIFYMEKAGKASCHNLLDSIMRRLSVPALSEDTVIHVHNASLGKNPVLTYALYLLARKGARIFNHCHDFADDGRPENMSFLSDVIEGTFSEKLSDVLYPSFSNIFYGVLNSRDYSFLKAKLPESSALFLLPNPVHFHRNFPDAGRKAELRDIFSRLTGADMSKKLVTYPVRAIRRKNIGEFVLLAALFGDTANFQITLDPLNENERENYLEWKEFSDINGLNVIFGMGRVMKFQDILLITDFCATTSVKEGFGMAFLEPWLFRLPVVGRRIDYVTNDFINEGIVLDRLYDKLEIPSENGPVDFPHLSREEQMAFIKRISNDASVRDSFFGKNRFLKDLFKTVPPELIEKNRRKVMMNYSVESYGEKLYEIYKRMLDGVPGTFPAAS